jgi:hypothetical protein
MKAKFEIDLSEILIDEESIGDVLRQTISEEIRMAIKREIKNDKRFSCLVKDAANLFFQSVVLVKK